MLVLVCSTNFLTSHNQTALSADSKGCHQSVPLSLSFQLFAYAKVMTGWNSCGTNCPTARPAWPDYSTPATTPNRDQCRAEAAKMEPTFGQFMIFTKNRKRFTDINFSNTNSFPYYSLVSVTDCDDIKALIAATPGYSTYKNR